MLKAWYAEKRDEYAASVGLPTSYAIQVRHRYGGLVALLDEWWDMRARGARVPVDASLPPPWQEEKERPQQVNVTIPYAWMDYLAALAMASGEDLGMVIRHIIEERNAIRAHGVARLGAQSGTTGGQG